MADATTASPRFIDQIRRRDTPSEILKTAAAGDFDRPLAEKLEVLVFLTSNALVGEQARSTLARFADSDLADVAADPKTPKRVLNYFLLPLTRRKLLLPDLIENPTVPDSTLSVLAYTASREMIDVLLSSPRVQKSAGVLCSLVSNAAVREEDLESAKTFLAELGGVVDIGSVYDHDVELWMLEHENEIAAEEGKEFLLTDALADEKAEVEAAATASPEASKRISPLQKIGKMTVGERVKLAMLGNKEERSILIRDGSRVVYSAVLASPKLTDSEVETIAGMKNVQEGVIRELARKRKFLKNYNVVRQLVNNPRCPLDISITFVKNLLGPDLKGLSLNKNVPETLKKTALRSFKEKTTPGGGKG